VPTIAETVPLRSERWSGIVAPKGTSAAIVETLYGAVKTVRRSKIHGGWPIGVSELGSRPRSSQVHRRGNREVAQGRKFAGLKASDQRTMSCSRLRASLSAASLAQTMLSATIGSVRTECEAAIDAGYQPLAVDDAG